MRLRILVPRGGRGGGLGRLTRRRRGLAALASCFALAWLGACGGGDDRAEPADPTATPAAAEPEARSGPSLAIGITEPNPAFVRPEGDVPPPFDRWRDELRELRPRHYRLVVDWASLEDDLGTPRDGCMRELGPCAGFAGLTAQLDALAAAQKAADGRAWETLVVITGTPERYAQGPSGCERAGTEPRSRPPTAEGIEAYGRFVERVQEAADAAGARLRDWSPWNEPNHPFGLSPQRARCSAKARPAAVEPYVAMARALRERLRDGQRLVLGELAGLLQRKEGYIGVGEFIGALPEDVVCAAPVFGQHGYVGGPDPVDEVAAALERFGCERPHEIWMTETGAGAARRGAQRGATAAAQRRACRNIRKRLRRWYEDERVTAAFQYTLREDDRFPTGLVTTDLSAAYPALAEWQAWGGDRDPADPPAGPRCAAAS